MSQQSPSSEQDAPPSPPSPRPTTNHNHPNPKRTLSKTKNSSSTTTTLNLYQKPNHSKKSVLGTTILPVTRVTRAAKQDKDIKIVSKEAVFLISIATEFFIKKLTQSAFQESKREKRVFVKYNDIATAVQMNPEYTMLDQIIPPSRGLSSILNDPMIPTCSTAITNQLPIGPPLARPPKMPARQEEEEEEEVGEVVVEMAGEDVLVAAGEEVKMDVDVDVDEDEDEDEVDQDEEDDQDGSES